MVWQQTTYPYIKPANSSRVSFHCFASSLYSLLSTCVAFVCSFCFMRNKILSTAPDIFRQTPFFILFGLFLRLSVLVSIYIHQRSSFVRWLTKKDSFFLKPKKKKKTTFFGMENKRHVSGSSSSSSSSSSLDHLFGPKDSSSSSSSTNSLFGTIFPPPSVVLGRDSTHSGNRGSWNNQALNHHGRSYGNPDHTDYGKGQSSSTKNKDKTSSPSIYHNESVEPSYLSSSIYYGGQENYSPRNKTTDTSQYFKKDDGDDAPDGNNSSGASRGNWWQGSLYY